MYPSCQRACPFVEWIQKTIQRLIGVAGAIHRGVKPGHRPIWTLRYAKASSIRILRWMYHSPGAPCLARKRAKAEKFLSPLGSVSQTPSRATAGRLAIQCRGATSCGRGRPCRGGEMADSRRSKRRARKGVRVQVPPPVPPFLDKRRRPAGNVMSLWGCSSVGRAQGWQSWGQGFDSPQLHQITDAGLRSHLRPRVAVWGAVKIRTANSPARLRTAPPTAARSSNRQTQRIRRDPWAAPLMSRAGTFCAMVTRQDRTMPGKIRPLDQRPIRLSEPVRQTIERLARLANVTPSEIVDFILTEVLEEAGLPEPLPDCSARVPTLRRRRALGVRRTWSRSPAPVGPSSDSSSPVLRAIRCRRQGPCYSPPGCDHRRPRRLQPARAHPRVPGEPARHQRALRAGRRRQRLHGRHRRLLPPRPLAVRASLPPQPRERRTDPRAEPGRDAGRRRRAVLPAQRHRDA